MKDVPEIKITNDGSSTLFLPLLNEHYHSIHGAIQESVHVFIKNGIQKIPSNISQVNILEIGFGTGLNALLTLDYSNKNNLKVNYHTIEPYPIQDEKTWSSLNYCELLNNNLNDQFKTLHKSSWNHENLITSLFSFYKYCSTVESSFLKKDFYDVIYFDAFSPRSQPELWDESILEKMYLVLKKNGFLVTYCSKGIVKRKLKKIGFVIDSLPGPPGKREMTFAKKS
tara:strand:- start:143 stop:820 length:678 start_codon:yes stop_codon:yes gene_type:complete